MSKDAKDEPATKRDVEEIVGRVVGEVVGDALQLISDRFDKVDARFDRVEQRLAQQGEEIAEVRMIAERTERKVDATVSGIDEQSIRIDRLEQQTA